MPRKRIRESIKDERKTAFYVWCFPSDLDRLLAVGHDLHLRATDANQVARLLVRGIARGDFAVVPVRSQEELECTIKCVDYIRYTFGVLHNPQAKPLRNILLGLRAAGNAIAALSPVDTNEEVGG